MRRREEEKTSRLSEAEVRLKRGLDENGRNDGKMPRKGRNGDTRKERGEMPGKERGEIPKREGTREDAQNGRAETADVRKKTNNEQ
jgi:hypothetical protein